MVNRYQITIEDTGETYSCLEGQHLLKGMASMGKRGIPSGCHGGGCGVCKIRISGSREAYRTLPMSREHVTEAEEKEGIVLACRTFPLADLRLEVLGKIKKNVLRNSSSGYVFGQPIKTKKTVSS
ncbi:2Fe-2S iron-sulfur cluster-binding protein [Thiolapillus brandeum]|uniref:Ferredoxin n=1 Tax=Thiolapillus brandeum TaxID=1076588 RepID=A0A7U6GHS1_9GAMM|nr:2Fe-2S iron-sulfur cluster-binding protein [Thiolapillus brandeum]BAO43844.1 ferredoxin [Thiolapillus brandeum]